MTQPITVGNETGSPDKKAVAAFHKRDDCDVSYEAHHHTIGTGLYQAASGKHNHKEGGVPLFDATTDIVSGSRNLATGDLPGIVNQLLNILANYGLTNSTTP